MTEKKKIIFIDMDGVLVDLDEAILEYKSTHTSSQKFEHSPDLIPGLFKDPNPIKGAIDAINKLQESGKYELIIATSAPWDNPPANTHKRIWIGKYFGELFKKNMVITHRKDLLMGDYLIDDRTANGAREFGGELLHFGRDYTSGQLNKYPTWESILKKLL